MTRYDLSGVRTKPSKKHPEGKVRHGLKKCGECRKQFTCAVGTVFEHARMPLTKMLQAVHLMCRPRRASARTSFRAPRDPVQERVVPVAPHPRGDGIGNPTPMGGWGKIVEADETYHWSVPPSSTDARRAEAYTRLRVACRWSSVAVKFVHVHSASATMKNIRPIVLATTRIANPCSRPTRARHYKGHRHEFTGHITVNALHGRISARQRPHQRAGRLLSRSSSAACAASTSIAPSSICTDIWRSSISGTATASSWALMTNSVRSMR